MGKYGKKIAAPVVVVVILALYNFSIGWILFIAGIPLPVKIPGIVITSISTVLFVAVLAGRIREIRSGVEDDLGKY